MSAVRAAPLLALLATLALAIAPRAAFAACTGKLAELVAHAGQYRGKHDVLQAPAMVERLARLPEELHLHLQRNLDVSGPAQLEACHLVLSGNAPHMGTEQDAMLDVDLASGSVLAAIHGEGRIDIYVIADATAAAPTWSSLPQGMREWAVKADMGFPLQPPSDFSTQPDSVQFHMVPPTPANPVAPAPAPLKLDFNHGATTPTPAQAAAILRASDDYVAACIRKQQGCYQLVTTDLNDDGRPDLLAQYTDAAGYCGSAGCGGVIVLATAQGYAATGIGLANFYGELDVLPGMHLGMHDLRYNGDSPRWQWNGKDYDLNRVQQPGSGAQPWRTAQATGGPLTAFVAPIDSTIKHLLVSCEHGQPLLAMLTKQPRAVGPVTLTFVFNGWVLNLPLQPNRYNPNLWTADLSRSDLPLWLAHRGRTPTTDSLARAATMAYLRINGDMQGQISLANSTTTTKAALESCLRQ